MTAGDCVLSVRDLVLHKGEMPYSFKVHPGLTLVHAGRETGATTLSLAIAGRFHPVAGTVGVGDQTETSTRARFAEIALAGVPLIDNLERNVAVREVIREQVAWAQPFFARVPRDILGHRLVAPWLEPLGLAELDPQVAVGEMCTLDRMRLRVLLALIARSNAALLVVDDPDQLRSTQLRGELLANLHAVSAHLPVIAVSVNPDEDGVADHVIDLSEPDSAAKPEAAAEDETPAPLAEEATA